MKTIFKYNARYYTDECELFSAIERSILPRTLRDDEYPDIRDTLTESFDHPDEIKREAEDLVNELEDSAQEYTSCIEWGSGRFNAEKRLQEARSSMMSFIMATSE